MQHQIKTREKYIFEDGSSEIAKYAMYTLMLNC